MVTTATLRRRLEALERGPSTQETKIFFLEGEDPTLIQDQWDAVTKWQQAHPWGQVHVIVCEEVSAPLDKAYAIGYGGTGSDG